MTPICCALSVEIIAAPTLSTATYELPRERLDLGILNFGLPDGSGPGLLPAPLTLARPPVAVFSASDPAGLLGQQAGKARRATRTTRRT